MYFCFIELRDVLCYRHKRGGLIIRRSFTVSNTAIQILSKFIFIQVIKVLTAQNMSTFMEVLVQTRVMLWVLFNLFKSWCVFSVKHRGMYQAFLRNYKIDSTMLSLFIRHTFA